MIKKLEPSDLTACAKILMAVYNNELWQCRWTLTRARDYLADLVANHRFVGFALWIDDQIAGAVFCHEKIWWDSNEIFIDEMFVSPQRQRQGHGAKLLRAVEGHVRDHGLAGITLTTNQLAPAPDFYRKNGFSEAEQVLFMYNVMD